ncbi:hypothetical protein ACWEPM_15355 [Streptomyces sp. NPDC004244]|uniref:hypothetical protein n=1 Tax=Streptomyces sp. NPDC101206 TaxID=3366128 RepID=UPI0037FEBD13
MHNRTTTAGIAAASSFLLLSAVGPADAHPVPGQLSYAYTDGDGRPDADVLRAPESGVCIDLPALRDAPAVHLHNDSPATVELYGTRDCLGQPLGTVRAGERSTVHTFSVWLALPR